MGSPRHIAFFKFCYVDIEDDANVKEVFDYYINTMDQIKKEYPDLKLIHVTSPLYVHAMGIKGFVKRILKPDISNVRRNEFNQLLTDKYKDSEPIYDLARVESTLHDGRRVTFEHKGKEYFSLASEYTYDGGHLNETGKFHAAKELLTVLSKIAGGL